MKIIGVLPVYEEVDWLEYAVRGIIDFVDVLIIPEGYQGPFWHFFGNRSGDGTLGVLDKIEKEYPQKIKRMECSWKLIVGEGRCKTYNNVLNLLKSMGLYQEDNWFFLVDSDEFYDKEQLQEIKKTINNTDKDLLIVCDRMFVYNFKYFIPASHGRLFRITPGLHFKPTQFPCYADGTDYVSHPEKVGYVLESQPMFHYTFVRHAGRMYKRIQMEFLSEAYKSEVFVWFREVFMRWTKERAPSVYKKNQEITGTNGILFAGTQGKLQEYKGDHPEVLNDHPYRWLDDVRKVSFKSNSYGNIFWINLLGKFHHLAKPFAKPIFHFVRKIKNKFL